MISYLFAEVDGFSKFGSYVGNGSADGPFVYCGFRPAFVMFKRVDAAGYGWNIYDSTRDNVNPESLYVNAESSATESSYVTVDYLSNGFKLRLTVSPNISGGTYIFIAFAEAPFKYANAR